MRTFAKFLQLLASVILVAGLLHLVLGLGADVLLGARVPANVLADPALDSQNRFYGIAFTLYGVLLFLCASNLHKYATVLQCVLWVFFAAGLARLVSIALYGIPPTPVLILLASELAAPPLLVWWFSRAQREGQQFIQAEPASRVGLIQALGHMRKQYHLRKSD